MLSLLRDYVAKRGWDTVTHKLVVPPGANLGTWIQHRRAAYRKGKIAAWLEEELESIPGWEWDPIRARHQKHLDAVLDFLEEHSWDELTKDTWCHRLARIRSDSMACWPRRHATASGSSD